MPFRDVSPGAMGMAELAAAPINAFYGAQDDAVRNKLNTLRVQQVQNELDDDAEWDAAYARKDWDTLRRLDPEATELLVAHERQKAMSGLEDISISRQKIDMAPLIRREDDQWNQVRDQRNENRRYGLDVARLNRERSGGGISFAEYEAMPPERKAAYDQFMGRNKGGGGGITVGPDGQLMVDPASIKATGDERKTAALGVRLEAAMQNLEAIRQRNPGADVPTMGEKVAGRVGGEFSANLVRSPDRQQADAAQGDALDAALTLATGAAYTKEQLETLRKAYFPQLGDSPETVRFKEMMFSNIVQAARVNAGRAEPLIDQALRNSASQKKPAPKAALDYLKANPETAPEFEAKYGYRPDGF